MNIKALALGIITSLALAMPSTARAALYNGNGNTGFGGTAGAGSLTLTDDGTTVSGTFTRGSADLNDALVIYLDTTAGGYTSTASFTDTGDALRRAISGFDGSSRSTVNFASGFDADYVLALDQGYGGLWDLVENGSHTSIDSINLSPTGTTSAGSYSFSFDWTEVGLTGGTGATIGFQSTYLNSGNAFRSDESFESLVAGNPGHTALNFSGFNNFTGVPEPTHVALGIFGVMVGGAGLVSRLRHRKNQPGN